MRFYGLVRAHTAAHGKPLDDQAHTVVRNILSRISADFPVQEPR